MAKIIAVRHGQTRANKTRRVIGTLDSPLTKEGVTDVKKTANVLKKENIDLFFSSDLGRCIKTAEMINEYHNAKIKYTPVLRERDYGVFDGKPIDDIAAERKRVGLPRYKFRPQKGESYEDLKQRVEPFLKKIASEDKTILLVTHGDVIRIISWILLNRPPHDLAKMRFHCASINIFESKNGKFQVKKVTRHLN